MLNAKQIMNGVNRKTEKYYVGEVVSHEDPLKLGRLKIRIPELYGDVPVAHIPWANPSVPFGGGAGYGFFFIPVPGSKVRVRLWRGNSWFPEWYGVHWFQGETPTEAQLNPPLNYVIKTPKAQLIDMHDGQGYIRIKDFNGNYITIDGSQDNLLINIGRDKRENVGANSDETIANSKRISVGGNFDLDVAGSVNIRAGGVVAIDGATIQLNGGVASPTSPTAPEDVSHE